MCLDCEAYGLKKHGLTRSDCTFINRNMIIVLLGFTNSLISATFWWFLKAMLIFTVSFSTEFQDLCVHKKLGMFSKHSRHDLPFGSGNV